MEGLHLLKLSCSTNGPQHIEIHYLQLKQKVIKTYFCECIIQIQQQVSQYAIKLLHFEQNTVIVVSYLSCDILLLFSLIKSLSQSSCCKHICILAYNINVFVYIQYNVILTVNQSYMLMNNLRHRNNFCWNARGNQESQDRWHNTYVNHRVPYHNSTCTGLSYSNVR
jgi:hypothetical protein